MSGSAGHRRPRGEGRRIRVDVRVNETEHRGLTARARERGVSVARLLVEAALGAPPLPAPRRLAAVEAERFDQLEETRRDLSRTWGELNSTVGNNLNQLAHAANIAGEVVSERRLAEAIARLDEMRERMVDAVLALDRAAVRIGRGWADYDGPADDRDGTADDRDRPETADEPEGEL